MDLKVGAMLDVRLKLWTFGPLSWGSCMNCTENEDRFLSAPIPGESRGSLGGNFGDVEPRSRCHSIAGLLFRNLDYLPHMHIMAAKLNFLYSNPAQHSALLQLWKPSRNQLRILVKGSISRTVFHPPFTGLECR